MMVDIWEEDLVSDFVVCYQFDLHKYLLCWICYF